MYLHTAIYLLIKRKIEDRKWGGLPYGCRQCEVLGMCRRPREQGWKCYNGCMLIEQKWDGLPRRCRTCERLKECRRPKEQHWKCYHGCLILNEKQDDTQK